MNTPTLLTLGYQLRSSEEFLQLLSDASVDVLVDVRETAWSHKAGFSKRGLEVSLRSRNIAYVHARFVGNPKRLRTDAPTHEECLRRYEGHIKENSEIFEMFDELICRLIEAEKRVCVTCYERHPDDCHRGLLAGWWRDMGHREVVHLGVDESCRLVAS